MASGTRIKFVCIFCVVGGLCHKVALWALEESYKIKKATPLAYLRPGEILVYDIHRTGSCASGPGNDQHVSKAVAGHHKMIPVPPPLHRALEHGLHIADNCKALLVWDPHQECSLIGITERVYNVMSPTGVHEPTVVKMEKGVLIRHVYH